MREGDTILAMLFLRLCEVLSALEGRDDCETALALRLGVELLQEGSTATEAPALDVLCLMLECEGIPPVLTFFVLSLGLVEEF